MQLDFSDGRFWLDALQMLGLIALWLRRPGEDAGRRVDAIERKVDVIDERIKHMPTGDELTDLEGTVKEIRARMDGLQENVRGTREAVTRIENFLRETR
jgi:predicted  nucleic acid-binding Zn-ribbon protein